jgi:hypothetical protein
MPSEVLSEAARRPWRNSKSKREGGSPRGVELAESQAQDVTPHPSRASL